MVEIHSRLDDNESYFRYKCEYGDGTIRFFGLKNISHERIPEGEAYYSREEYAFLTTAESLETFQQEQQLLNILEE